VHLRHDRLDPFLRGHFIETLPRLHRHYDRKGTLRWIDFRRVIESLRRKPRALLRAQLQAEILPGELLTRSDLFLRERQSRLQLGALALGDAHRVHLLR
jgi:hypothetical protein